MTGLERLHRKPLKIGDIALANSVLLAPMSGVTDAPFRRLAARLGAGLVVSEMTASDDLARGRPMSRLRCEAAGIGPHVVQLAGCETRWMAEGARIAEAGRRRHHRHQHGLSGPPRDRRPVRLGSDARSRSCRDADRGDDRGGEGAGDAEDAARLGRALAQRAGTGAPGGGCRRADDHRARPHALPVLQGRGRLGRGARRARTRSPFRSSSTATSPRSRRRVARSSTPAPTP